MRDTTVVQSVEKAMMILELFSKKEPMLALHDISTRTSFNKTTALRFCNSLEKCGVLEKVFIGSTPYYRLGIELFHLGSLVMQSFDLPSRAKPYLQKMSETLDDTIYLFIEKRGKAHCIALEKGNFLLRDESTELGDTLPLVTGGAPLAILAFLEPKKRVEVVEALGWPDKETEALNDRLQDIRNKGYSLSMNEVYPDTAAIGVPIFNHEGSVAAAFSVGGLLSRFSEERLPIIIDAVEKSARQLSKELGWIPEKNDEEKRDTSNAYP